MKTSPLNYQSDFYRDDEAYRGNLVAALQHFGLTEFKKGEEFWTLGAKEWHEYRYLKDNGIKFAPGTYHNVDRGLIDSPPDQGAVRHNSTEFTDIHKLWTNPRAICYDSTEGLVDSNINRWNYLVSLVGAAARKSGFVFFTWNFMTGYGNLPFRGDYQSDSTKPEYDNAQQAFAKSPMVKRLKYWVEILIDYCECEGLNCDSYKYFARAPKQSSQTPMICGHFLIST